MALLTVVFLINIRRPILVGFGWVPEIGLVLGAEAGLLTATGVGSVLPGGGGSGMH